MSRSDFTEIFDTINLQRTSSSIDGERQTTNRTHYQLVNVPIVYHVLPNQNGGGKLKPFLTKKQEVYTTHITNQLFNIYDKQSKQSVQFIQFVTNATIIHKNIRTNVDCPSLSDEQVQKIVTKASEWQFKLHVFVCEINYWSGMATFPGTYPMTDPSHNKGKFGIMIHM
jgi:hypothetical protein